MRLKTILCGEFGLIDVTTNRTSLINILDEVASPQFPVLLPQFAVHLIMERDSDDDAEGTCEVAVLLNDQALTQGLVLLNFGEGYLSRAMVNMQGLVIPLPGRLVVEVSAGGNQLGAWTIAVAQREIQLGAPS